jgi:UDPglucose--hexose-1-phosphate uridylyltransferase
MHARHLTKADGRTLHLYGRQPVPDGLDAPMPRGGGQGGASHLRYHPLRDEWVIYAAHRQERTFLPPPGWNPLAPATNPDAPTEVPAGAWDVAVFENLFPALSRRSAEVEPPRLAVDSEPGTGACEVVVFTQDPAGSLGRLPLDHVELVLEVWAERTRELGARDDVAYVFPFENRGVEVGVTLQHPHGQIYAYPFVPPIMARELAQQASYRAQTGKNLFEQLITNELADGQRLVWREPHALAFVPVCARYAYEVWLAPVRPVAMLADLAPDERRELARTLKAVLGKLDGLWQSPMPYVLAVHQGPTDGHEHPEAHVHLEIYPAYRMPGRLKYLAGSEVGAGVFTSDTLPERKAAELRDVEVDLA